MTKEEIKIKLDKQWEKFEKTILPLQEEYAKLDAGDFIGKYFYELDEYGYDIGIYHKVLKVSRVDRTICKYYCLSLDRESISTTIKTESNFDEEMSKEDFEKLYYKVLDRLKI